MNQQNYNCSITASVTPKQAMNGINNVSGWWAKNFEGKSENLNDVFTVHFGKTFVTFKITEMVADKKVVWLATDGYMDWLKDKKEWDNTKVVFEIVEKGNATEIHFTHVGLAPGIECYNDCVKGWDQYVKDSLYKLLTENKGQPN
jgi:hypothetical protein